MHAEFSRSALALDSQDAGYARASKFAKPDGQGVQRMLACRVLVGEYTAGTADCVVPPQRREGLNYDSTVDHVQCPEIHVAFNDAAAYPEYLITFKQAPAFEAQASDCL
jgi:hypothetical protein